MKFVGAGLGDHVDHRAAGASGFGGNGIRRDAEFLDDFIGKLIGSAIASAGLGEEGVVVVGAIDQVAGLEAANAAEGEIAVGGGVEAAGILRDSGSEQGEVGEAASVQRKIENGAFVDDRGQAARFGFDSFRLGGDGDGFVGSGERHFEDDFDDAADVYVQRSD